MLLTRFGHSCRFLLLQGDDAHALHPGRYFSTSPRLDEAENGLQSGHGGGGDRWPRAASVPPLRNNRSTAVLRAGGGADASTVLSLKVYPDRLCIYPLGDSPLAIHAATTGTGTKETRIAPRHCSRNAIRPASRGAPQLRRDPCRRSGRRPPPGPLSDGSRRHERPPMSADGHGERMGLPRSVKGQPGRLIFCTIPRCGSYPRTAATKNSTNAPITTAHARALN